MIINSILGTKKSSTTGSSLNVIGSYSDFIRFQNEGLSLGFAYLSDENLDSVGAYFVDGTLVGSNTFVHLNEWDVNSYLTGIGPKLLTFRVVSTDYKMNQAKIDFRVVYDYIEYNNMIFGLTENGNFKLVEYTGSSEVVNIFKYSYITGYGIKLLTQLDGTAFYNKQGVKTVKIPESVNKIGNTAFTNCSDLSLVEIYTEIPPTLESTNAFNGTESGLIIKVPAVSLAEYEIHWAGKINGAVLQAL